VSKLFWKKARSYGRRPLGFGVDLIYIHYTAGYDAGDLHTLTRTGVSSHFLIHRNGDVYWLVRLKDMAYHAGIKHTWPWQRKRWRALRPNERSIGIEVGNFPPEEFTEEQYRALEFLLPILRLRFNIPNETLSDPYRGCDPRVRDAYELEALKGFRGLLAHGNTHFSKVDPGRDFDWNRIKAIPPIVSPGCFAKSEYIIYIDDPGQVGKGLTYG